MFLIVITSLLITVALPCFCVVWKLVLGKAAYASVGAPSVVVATLCAEASLLVAVFVGSCFDVSAWAASGTLGDAAHWATIANRTITAFTLSLFPILPAIGVFAVPISAVLVRRRALNYFSLIAALALIWVLLIGLSMLVPEQNEWGRGHHWESLIQTAGLLAMVTLVVGLPFFLVRRYCTRQYVRPRPVDLAVQ